MQPFKILHITETFAAGVYLYIRDLCRFTELHGGTKNFIIYSGKRQDTSFHKFLQDFSENTVLTRIDMKREISPIDDFRAVAKLSKLIKEINPSIIHLHSSKAGALGRIASVNYSGKVFYTPNGYAFLRTDISIFRRMVYRLSESILSKIFKAVIIACGDSEYEFAKKMGKAFVVRNSVNVEEITKYNSGEKNNRIVIGTIGRLCEQKNPVLFNRLAERFPEISFVWIGDGELRDRLKFKNIEVTGWLDREKALKRLSGFDIYIQTSSWEGLPFTLLEAMAMGKPVVVSSVAGNKDAVRHGENGFLCESLDDFESNLKKLLNDSEKRDIMGDQSLVLVKEFFNRERNLKKILDIYREYPKS